MTTTPSLDDRLFQAAVRSGPLDLIARRALRKAVPLLGLLFAHRLQELRSREDPVMEAQGRIEEQATLVGAKVELSSALRPTASPAPPSPSDAQFSPKPSRIPASGAVEPTSTSMGSYTMAQATPERWLMASDTACRIGQPEALLSQRA